MKASLLLVLIGACVVGWIENILAIARAGDEVSNLLAWRYIGVFVAPLGALLGYI